MMLDSISLQHGNATAPAPVFRRHNSCVDFTFLQDRTSTNSHKLTRLNLIFEKAADRRSGGIREDKLARILPAGPLTAQKYVMLLNGSKRSNKENSNRNNESNGRKKKKDLRIISRGPFLAMLANESVAFLNSLALNEKLDREKRQRRSNNSGGKRRTGLTSTVTQTSDTGSGTAQRERAHTAPVGGVCDGSVSNIDPNSFSSSPPPPPPPVKSPTSISSSLSPSHSKIDQLNGRTSPHSKKNKTKSKDRKNRDDNHKKKKRDGRSRRKKERSSSGSRSKSDERVPRQDANSPDTREKLTMSPPAEVEVLRPSVFPGMGNMNDLESAQTFPPAQIANVIPTPESQPASDISSFTVDENVNRISYSYSSSSGSDGESTKDAAQDPHSDSRQKERETKEGSKSTKNGENIPEIDYTQKASSKSCQRSPSGTNPDSTTNASRENDLEICFLFSSFLAVFKKIFPPKEGSIVGVSPIDRTIENSTNEKSTETRDNIVAGSVIGSSDSVTRKRGSKPSLKRRDSSSSASRRSGSSKAKKKKSRRSKVRANKVASDSPFKVSSKDVFDRDTGAKENGFHNSSQDNETGWSSSQTSIHIWT